MTALRKIFEFSLNSISHTTNGNKNFHTWQTWSITPLETSRESLMQMCCEKKVIHLIFKRLCRRIDIFPARCMFTVDCERNLRMEHEKRSVESNFSWQVNHCTRISSLHCAALYQLVSNCKSLPLHVKSIFRVKSARKSSLPAPKVALQRNFPR